MRTFVYKLWKPYVRLTSENRNGYLELLLNHNSLTRVCGFEFTWASGVGVGARPFGYDCFECVKWYISHYRRIAPARCCLKYGSHPCPGGV